jgi:acetyl-CoA synthetase
MSPLVDAHVPRWPAIEKRPDQWRVPPNLRDYERERATFSWDQARRRLDGLPGGLGLNIAHEAVDRHTTAGAGGRIALRWISRTGERRDLTYADLRSASNRFANVLIRLGVRKGDVVATLSGRIPALYVAALGALKNRSVMRRCSRRLARPDRGAAAIAHAACW